MGAMGQGLAPCPFASQGLVEGNPPQPRLLEEGIGTGARLLLPAPSALPAQRQQEAIPAAGPLLPSRCVLP